MFVNGCHWALESCPAVLEAGEYAWWLDKGAGSTALQGVGVALMRAAKAFSQGLERGHYDKLQKRNARDKPK